MATQSSSCGVGGKWTALLLWIVVFVCLVENCNGQELVEAFEISDVVGGETTIGNAALSGRQRRWAAEGIRLSSSDDNSTESIEIRLYDEESLQAANDKNSNEIELRMLSHAGDEDLLAYILYFGFIYLFAAVIALSAFASLALCPFTPPVSIVWFIFGGIMSLLAEHHNMGLIGTGIRLMGNVPSEIIFLVLLPVLLYEGAVGTSWHKFTRMWSTSFVLAYLGVGFTTVVLAGLFYATFPVFQDNSRGVWEAMLLGSSLASTDPVAVISVLKSLHTPEKMLSMFEGESLLNDGTSVAFFQFFRVFAQEQEASAGEIVWLVFRLLCLGPIFGGLWSLAACLVVQNFHSVPKFQVMFLLSNLYLSFFVAEHYLKFSGPMTAVFFGLYICYRGKTHLEAEAQEVHHSVVSTLAVFAESAIFIVSGNVAIRVNMEIEKANFNEWKDLWLDSFIIYLYMNLVRAVMFLMMFPILRRTIYGFSWSEMIILIWGGLRGSIVLALALMIEDEIGADGYRDAFAQFAVFTISTAALFILAVNGTFFSPVFKILNPYPCTPFRRVYLTKVMTHIDEEFEKRLEDSVQSMWILKQTNIDVASYAKKLVPELSWRQVDKHGRMPRRTPHLRQTIRKLQKEAEAERNNVAKEVSAVASSDEASMPHIRIDKPESTRKGSNFSGSMSYQAIAHQDHHPSVQRSQLATSSARRQNVDLCLPKTSNFDLLLNLKVTADRSRSHSMTPPPPADDSDQLRSPSSSPSSAVSPSQSLSPGGGNKASTYKGSHVRRLSHRDTLDEVQQYLHDNEESEMNLEEIRKERVSEIYVMVCNALKNCYSEFLENNFIGGKAFAKLEKSLDVAQDFSMTLLSEGDQLWETVLRDYPEYQRKLNKRHWENYKRGHGAAKYSETLNSAFEIEWQALRGCLSTDGCLNHFVSKIKWMLPRGITLIHQERVLEQDVQAVLAYIYAHEDLLQRGGDAFERMLAGKMIQSYLESLEAAKKHLVKLMNLYPEAFNVTLLRTVATHLVNIKQHVVDEHARNGMLSSEDKEQIAQILDKQRQRIFCWNHLDFRGLCMRETDVS